MFYEHPSTAIGDAAWRGDIGTVRELVKSGVSINAEDASGANALYLAARGGHPIGPHNCGREDDNRPAVIAAMLEMGADPNQRDRRPRVPGGSSGWTPLFVALHHDQFKSAAVLIRHGANVNIKSDQGMTVLEMAQSEGAPQELVELIKSKSVN
jgi:uncharacterized protein